MSNLLEYAKTFVAIATAVLVAVQAQWIDAPTWVPAVIAGLGAVAVFLTPNKPPATPPQEGN